MIRHGDRVRRAIAAALALLVLGTLATTATAIYEDQVGSFDWHKEHLGRVTHATFAGSKANKRAFVATEQGAIGSLDFNTGAIGASSEQTRPSRNGQRKRRPRDARDDRSPPVSRDETRRDSIARRLTVRLSRRALPSPPSFTASQTAWRHMLEPGDAVDHLVVAGRVLLSLSSGGKYLRGWSLKDGTLLWEAVTYTAAAPSAEVAKERGADRGVDLLPLSRDVDGDGAEDVLVLVRGEVQMRSLSDGVIAWIAEAVTRSNDELGNAGEDVARFNRLAVFGAGESNDAVVVVGATAERGHPIAAEIDASSGVIRRVAVATGVLGLDAGAKMTISATDADRGVAVLGAARNAGAGADEAPTKLFVLDLGKLLALAGSRSAGRDVASVFAVPGALEMGTPGGPIALEPVRGADSASDVVAARGGAALASGSERCALVALDPVADGAASKKPADRVRAIASWPLDASGACPAALSPAALLERADTKKASKTAPAAKRAALRVASLVADVAENVFRASTFSLEPSTEASPLPFSEFGALRPLERGGAAACWLAVDPKGGALSLLAVTADASLSLGGGDPEASWTREESVALAGEVLFARLPPPKSAAAAAADDSRVRPSFRQSLETQILAAKARFKRATPAELAELTAQRRSRGDKLLPTRDANGFRRQILFLSPDGALTSLHDGDGRQLWRTFLGGGVDAAGDPADAYRYAVLLPWRDGDDDDDEHALVLGTAETASRADGAPRRTRATVVDAYTGRITSDVVLPFEAAHVLPLLPFANEHEHDPERHENPHAPSAMLLVDAENDEARVFPDTADAARAASLDARRVSFFTVDQSRNEVRGYALVPPEMDDDTTADPRVYRTAQTWATRFPDELGSIVGFASKPPNEPTHAWTRVLGDRSTLFKYLSPNVIFVAVAPTATVASYEESAVSAHLLDAATGRVLYRVRHPEARGPVRAVVCENWVVYHYFNSRAGRHSMSVLELFDDSEHRKGVAAGELMMAALTGARDTGESVSSFAPPPLRIMGQSYYVRQSATLLKATYSRLGVTAHQVLMGTGTDQVVALDKRFLDPRRPTKPSREDREEGLVPYAEVLPIAPKSWVTTKHQVARLRGIVTAPANLESTVLCVAHGLDVFFTRLHPSRSYDMLDEEFSYLLLIVTLAALAFGALSTQGMVLAKDLDRVWK